MNLKDFNYNNSQKICWVFFKSVLRHLESLRLSQTKAIMHVDVNGPQQYR